MISHCNLLQRAESRSREQFICLNPTVYPLVYSACPLDEGKAKKNRFGNNKNVIKWKKKSVQTLNESMFKETRVDFPWLLSRFRVSFCFSSTQELRINSKW